MFAYGAFFRGLPPSLPLLREAAVLASEREGFKSCVFPTVKHQESRSDSENRLQITQFSGDHKMVIVGCVKKKALFLTRYATHVKEMAIFLTCLLFKHQEKSTM